MQRILGEIDGCTLPPERAISQLNTLFRDPAGRRYVLVLDEIDRLETKANELLYRLFEWPRLPASTVTLIAVANALDLTGAQIFGDIN